MDVTLIHELLASIDKDLVPIRNFFEMPIKKLSSFEEFQDEMSKIIEKTKSIISFLQLNKNETVLIRKTFLLVDILQSFQTIFVHNTLYFQQSDKDSARNLIDNQHRIKLLLVRNDLLTTEIESVKKITTLFHQEIKIIETDKKKCCNKCLLS